MEVPENERYPKSAKSVGHDLVLTDSETHGVADFVRLRKTT